MNDFMANDELNLSVENRRNCYRFIREDRDDWEINVDKNYLVTRNIVDINGTGLSFRALSVTPLELGQSIRVQISLVPEEVFVCTGKVAWVRPLNGVGSGLSHFGVQFEKNPAWIDARIVSRLQRRLLDESRNRLASSPSTSTKITYNFRWAHRELIGAFCLFMLMTSAVWLYSRNHPEKSLEVIFNQGLAKRMMSIQK